MEIPPPIREKIGETIEALRQSGADVKWVAPGNIHITLKFLGSTEESGIGAIADALRKKLLHYTPFYIKIAGTGYFPAGRHPRVVWVGIEDPSALGLLHGDIEQEMAAFGFPAEERGFSSHATVGRIRSGSRVAELVSLLKKSGDVPFGDFEVRSISIMKSDLRPAGPEYTRIAEIPFTNNTKP